MWNLLQLTEGLEGITMALLTRVHKWKMEEVQVLLAQVRKDLKNHRIHSYYKLYVQASLKHNLMHISTNHSTQLLCLWPEATRKEGLAVRDFQPTRLLFAFLASSIL